MKPSSAACGVALLVAGVALAGLPVDKVYGVNLGSWLLSESWMFPEEWKSMGGEVCDDCSKCAATEFALTQKLGQEQADQVFVKHWSTWFTQESVNAIADAGLNTVRIPLGYWIVESLVDRSTEFYPRGGMRYLKTGLRMLKAKGINVVLDLHALPGVSSANQMFAGRCTTDVQFYTEKNYNRALMWAGVMTAIIHMDPDFGTVFAIEAVNEPEVDANKTPGLGEYEKNFVKMVRAVEMNMGITCPDTDDSRIFSDQSKNSSAGLELGDLAKVADPSISGPLQAVNSYLPSIMSELGISSNKRALSMRDAGKLKPLGTPEGLSAIAAGGSSQLGSNFVASKLSHKRQRRSHRKRRASAPLRRQAESQCLMTTFMNKDWQFNNPANPADAAMGPQLYDYHLYFAYGGVADPNPESYLKTICNTDRVAKAKAVNNSPLVFGEWSLATNFDASDKFLHDWADAQRHIYAGQAEGWIFWNFKVEKGSVNVPAWSYLDSLERGFFNKDPSKLTNPDVCAPWIANNTSSG